ncbi:MAG TPA: DUF4252 domain-containing protein [Rhodothermales bacterium]
MKRILLLIGALMLPAAASAQAQSVLTDPGYLDLRVIESWFDEEATIEVNVQGALLNLVMEASRHEDEELAEMIGKLKGVYVRGYDVTADEVAEISSRTGQLANTLRDRGWETVVRVREDDQRVHVFMRTQQDRIAGLVVMVVDPEETIFVNIVGEIDPADIGRIGGRFNVPELGIRKD